MNKVSASFCIDSARPARTWVGVADLMRDTLIEVVFVGKKVRTCYFFSGA